MVERRAHRSGVADEQASVVEEVADEGGRLSVPNGPPYLFPGEGHDSPGGGGEGVRVGDRREEGVRHHNRVERGHGEVAGLDWSGESADGRAVDGRGECDEFVLPLVPEGSVVRVLMFVRFV